MARFDGSEWKNYTMKDGMPSNHIFMLHEDSKGKLWAGTSAGLVSFNNEGVLKVYTSNDGLYSNNVFSMAEGADNSRWIGSYGGVSRIVSLK